MARAGAPPSKMTSSLLLARQRSEEAIAELEQMVGLIKKIKVLTTAKDAERAAK